MSVENPCSRSSRTLSMRLSIQPTSLPPRVALTVVCVSWASLTILLRALHASCAVLLLHPLVFNAARLAVAALASIRASRTQNPPVLAMSNQSVHVLVGGAELGLYTLFVNLSQVAALRYLPAARVAFIAQLQTFIVPLIALLLSRTSNDFDAKQEAKVALRNLPFSVLALIGALLLTCERSSYGSVRILMENSSAGNLLALTSAVWASLYILRSRTLGRRYPSNVLASWKVLSHAIFACVHLALFVFRHKCFSWPDGHAFTAAFISASFSCFVINLALLLYAGIFVSFISTNMQIAAQARVSSSEAALIFAFNPVATSLFAAIILREYLSPVGIAGGATIMLATFASLTNDSMP